MAESRRKPRFIGFVGFVRTRKYISTHTRWADTNKYTQNETYDTYETNNINELEYSLFESYYKTGYNIIKVNVNLLKIGDIT
jgi:hypothetical protein